jgi:hypothetical protein
LPPLLSWANNSDLPFWGADGADAAPGDFHEWLDLAGGPVVDVPKRLMVQGRQLYVYCQLEISICHVNNFFACNRRAAVRLQRLNNIVGCQCARLN